VQNFGKGSACLVEWHAHRRLEGDINHKISYLLSVW